jgi:hypothetical protein
MHVKLLYNINYKDPNSYFDRMSPIQYIIAKCQLFL